MYKPSSLLSHKLPWSFIVGLFCFSVNASEVLTPVKINHCAEKFCFELNSEKAFKSFLDQQVLSFSSGNIKIYDAVGAKLQSQYSGSNGYIDWEIGYLVLRKVEAGKDLLLNLKSGQVTLL